MNRLLILSTLVLGCFGKPNFIVYQPDEMRAESLGCYGHKVSKTPNFDRFAAQGTRFDQAHVSYTVCSQSRVAFVTGWPTHVRGHRTLYSLLHDWEPNLLKYFKSAKYSVHWWGKNDMLAHDSWHASVDTARQSKGHNYGPNPYSMGDNRHYSFLSKPTEGPANTTVDYNNVAAAINWLKQRAELEAASTEPLPPFFLFLPLTYPHPPYSCPEPWYSSIDPTTLPPLRPIGGPGKPDYHQLIRQYRNLTALDESFWRELHAVYLGAISFSDYLFGLLLAAVDEYNFADTTTVAVFSDHGDYAGDYGLVEKWPSGLEDVLTRVPLIVRTPGGAQGHVVTSPVQVFDIVPTLLQMAGINATHVHFGHSLVHQIVHGAAGDPTRAVFAEGGYGTNEPRDLEGDRSSGGLGPKSSIYYPKFLQQQQQPMSVCRATSVRTLEYKLILRTDPTEDEHHAELYNLKDDPREVVNLYGNASYAAVTAELQHKLFLWYMQTSDVTPWRKDNRAGGMPWPPDVAVDTPLLEEGVSYL